MPILNYGTGAGMRRRTIIGALLLAIFVPAASWCVSLARRSFIAAREERARVTALRTEIRYQIDSNLGQAKDAIKMDYWADAQIAIDRARLAASAWPILFRSEEVRQQNTSIDQTQLALEKAELEKTKRDASHPMDSLQERTGVVVCRRPHVVQSLTSAADRLLSQKRYGEAMLTVEQILLLDPQNAAALKLRPLLVKYKQPTTVPASPDATISNR